jgi:hypothetical protein
LRFAAIGLLLLIASASQSAYAQYYRVGQIVTNFTVHSRRAWTNSVGKAFVPGSPVRLEDFAGKVVFAEFFDPT